MEMDNKVVSDLYKASGEALMTKSPTSSNNILQPSTMINKLESVRNLSELDESKINTLLRATDEL